MPFTQNGGARIYWRLEGADERPTLVLLHSIGTEKGLYDRVAPFLIDHFRLLRIDLRGHGASDANEGEYTLSLFADDTRAVMDAAGVSEAILCGTSLGAMVGMQFALDMPERLSGLVLACTSPGMNPALWPERIATVQASGMTSVVEGWVSRHFSAGFAAANPGLTRTQEHSVASMSPVGYVGAAAAIRDMDLADRIAGISVPTLLIAGEEDIATPYIGHGDRIVAAIPGAAAAFLPTGHLACVEQPASFAELVVGFAQRCGCKQG